MLSHTSTMQPPLSYLRGGSVDETNFDRFRFFVLLEFVCLCSTKKRSKQGASAVLLYLGRVL